VAAIGVVEISAGATSAGAAGRPRCPVVTFTSVNDTNPENV
jgi:hypothetical protein